MRSACSKALEATATLGYEGLYPSMTPHALRGNTVKVAEEEWMPFGHQDERVSSDCEWQ